MELSHALIFGVALYAAAILAAGLLGVRRNESFRDFVTAGAKAGPWLCAFSLVSTIIGSSATIGIGKLALDKGAGAFWWIGVGVVGLFLHGLWVAPRIRAMKALTLPHVVEMLAGRGAAKLSSLIIVVSWIAIVAAQFVALKAVLTSLAPEYGAVLYAVSVAVILFHTVLSGQRGVLYTDFLQTILLIGGFGAAFAWVLVNEPARVAAVDWIPFNSRFGFGDWLQLLLLVGFAYVVGPDMFSRTLAAKNEKTARRASWIASPMLFLFGIVITLLALTNLSAASPVADWLSEASPLSTALKAVLAIGLVSALSGSVDTVLFSSGAILEHTLIGRSNVLRLRFLLAAIGLLGVFMAEAYSNIIGLLISAYAFFIPGVAVPLFVVLMSGRTIAPKAWFAASIAGGLLGLAKFWAPAPWNAWTPLIGMAVSGLIAWGAIALSRRDGDDSDTFVLGS